MVYLRYIASEPTGVGTDLSVSRPIQVEENGERPGGPGPFGNLSEEEQRQVAWPCAVRIDRLRHGEVTLHDAFTTRPLI